MKKDKNIHQKIKQKIDSHEFDFEVQSWQKMEALLEKPTTSKPLYKAILKPIKLLTAMLLLLFIIWMGVQSLLPQEQQTIPPIGQFQFTKNLVVDSEISVLENDLTGTKALEIWQKADVFSPINNELQEAAPIEIDSLFQKELARKLWAYNQQYAPEKVYLQFDKKFFKPGDAIWFNAFLRDANSLKASKQSDLLYVELIAPNGNVQKKLTLNAKNGVAAGDFQLEKEAPGGMYKIKAYTNWQRNFEAAFERDIQVQASVLPNLRMELDFIRKAYGAGDQVETKLDFKTLENKALSHYDFSATASLDGQQFTTFNGSTDAKGHARISFQLPKVLKTNDGLLNVRIQYNGQTESIARAIPIILNKVDLQFFPEGGDLVAGVDSKIAFKAINEFGKPADVEGAIFNSRNEVVANFKSYHEGMGAFDLNAKKAENYTAKITKPKGITELYKLPESMPNGYALKIIENKKEGLKVQVTSTITEDLTLALRAGGKVVHSTPISIKADNQQPATNNQQLTTNNIQPGIAQITLFDSKGIPRAERLVFLNPDKKLNVEITTDKEKYQPREKVSMNIKVTDERDMPMPGQFSLAVADDKLLSFADDKQGNILAYLFLESELKGKIEEPNFYFEPKEKHPDKDQLLALDYLLLTQGWRRFAWEEVLMKQPIANLEFAEERAIIAGQILDIEGKPLSNMKVKLGAYEFVKTDALGQFVFDTLFFGNKYYYFESNGKEIVQNPFYVEHKKNDVAIIKLPFSKNDLKNNYPDGTLLVSERPYQTDLAGKIMDSETGEAIIFGNVALYQNGKLVTGTQTDFDGNYAISNIDPGSYDVEVSYIGYPSKKVEGVQIGVGKINRADVQLELDGALLQEVVVINYKVPLIEQDNTFSGSSFSSSQIRPQESGGGNNFRRKKKKNKAQTIPAPKQTTQGKTLTSEDIRNLPTKNINAIATTTGGINTESEPLNIRGSRVDAINYYIDGLKVTKPSIAQQDMAVPDPQLSGVPAILESNMDRAQAVPAEANKAIEFESGFLANRENIEEPVEFEDQPADEEIELMDSIDELPVSSIPPPPPPSEDEEDNLFKIVEQMPEFPGCGHISNKVERKRCAEERLNQFIYSNIRYPVIAKNNQIEGMVVVQFVVEEDGSISDAKLVRDIGGNCGKESLRMVKMMPRFKPGTQRGKAVKVQYNLPIRFKLDGSLEQKYNRPGYHIAREFYAPKYKDAEAVSVRDDFRSTIYWNPSIQTGRNGKATVEFYNSDDITTFKATVEGICLDGSIGNGSTTYFTQLPFGMNVKVPTNLLTGDLVKIPLTLSNNTDKEVSGELNINAPANFKLLQKIPELQVLKAKEKKTVFLSYQITKSTENGQFQIDFKADGLQDAFVQKVKVSSKGFPVSEIFSGNATKDTFEVALNNPIQGSIDATFTVHPTLISELVNGLDRMLRQPNGCFEQTSSCNYPNLLVLDYLKATKTENPEAEKKALDFLKKGYNRLLTFEVKGGGFDWYGKPAAHEGLTAYGLMEFKDMQAVYPVEQKLINRTAKWLLSRRDGKGSWKRNTKKRYAFGAQNILLGDAYIVWAMCEAGYSKDIQKELEKSYQDAILTQDPYIMGLVANALILSKKQNKATQLINDLLNEQNDNGSWTGKSTSITNSTGHGLSVETTALITLALMKQKANTPALPKAMDFLAKAKTNYGFGSTQSTILAMKALVAYAKYNTGMQSDGQIDLLVNGQKVFQKNFTADQKESIVFENLDQFLQAGKNQVQVQFSDIEKALPYDLSLNYNTRQPDNSENCPIALQTELVKSAASMGENIRLRTTISNQKEAPLANPIAIIGIPAGLSVQPWQLKEMQEKSLFDFYEVQDNGYVVFYFRGLKAKEKKVINLDLKAEIPGEYEAPASQAYLYYGNEDKVWSKPAMISVAE